MRRKKRCNARLALISRISRIAYVSLSPVLRAVETFYLRKLCKFGPAHPPIFIIGAPRTGSTYFYQLLTDIFDVSYIDNVACRWDRNLLVGMMLSNKRFGDAGHGVFKSDYGDTSRYSEHAPSECGGFWYKWLPRERHFIDYGDVDSRSRRQIYLYITGIINHFDKPFVFKNLNAGQRLRLLKECFPNAMFIHIVRDRDDVVKSILKARQRLGVPEGVMWSIRPRNYERILRLSEDDMVKKQVELIEDQITRDLLLFPEQQHITVRYEDVDASFVEAIGEKINLRPRRRP